MHKEQTVIQKTKNTAEIWFFLNWHIHEYCREIVNMLKSVELLFMFVGKLALHFGDCTVTVMDTKQFWVRSVSYYLYVAVVNIIQTGIFHWPALRKQNVICSQQESAGCANTDLHQEQRGEAASYSTINVSMQAISWQLDTLQLQNHALNRVTAFLMKFLKLMRSWTIKFTLCSNKFNKSLKDIALAIDFN